MRDSKNTKNTETIKTIELVFENCDSVKLLPTDLDQFSISKPKEQHSMEVLERVMFVLKKNKVFYEQGHEEEIGPRKSLYERIKRNDITQIYIELEGGKVEKYIVDYEDLDENDLCSPNKNQSWKEEDGQLIVTIEKKDNFLT